MIVGIVAVQGAFREHEQILSLCGVETRQVRLPVHLEGLDALIIPGGESTAMGRLLVDFSLLEPIEDKIKKGIPVFGTCAGMIMLAKNIEDAALCEGKKQPSLGIMDITVKRNAFGRQVESFEADLQIPVLGELPYHGVFIRAPYVTEAGKGVSILAAWQDKGVLVRQDNMLAAAFHPELTCDLRLHKYFLSMI